MFQNLLLRLSAPTEAIGLDVYVRPDGVKDYHAVLLVKEKNSFKLKAYKSWQGSLSELTEFAPSSLPVALSISGKGVLVKLVANANAQDPELMQRVLPNAKEIEFFIQKFPSGKNCFVALQRNEIADNLISELNTLGYQIAELSLGGLQTASIGLSLNVLSPWKFSHYQLEFSTVELSDYVHQFRDDLTTITNLGGETLTEAAIPAFCAALQYLAESSPSSVEKSILTEQKKEIRSRKLLQISLWGILLFFFFSLLINFVLFSSFSSTNNALQAKSVSASTLLKELDLLEKEVKEQNTFLTETGWLSDGKLSYLSDKIAASIPSGISLNQLNLQPLDDKKSKAEKKKVFDAGVIKIEGNCQKATSMNEWIETLKLIQDVQSVKLISYQYSDLDRKGKFEILMQLKP
jgi:Tfp pilus assembly protein PilN